MQYTQIRIFKSQLQQQLQGDLGEYRLFITTKAEPESHSFLFTMSYKQISFS